MCVHLNTNAFLRWHFDDWILTNVYVDIFQRVHEPTDLGQDEFTNENKGA